MNTTLINESSRNSSLQQVSDVACTVCGCVCDDLVVQVQDDQVLPVQNACQLATPWFEAIASHRPPAAQIDGRISSVDEAVEAAVDILNQSRSPLIYGLSRSSTPGQRAAIALGEKLGATVDTTASVCHGPSILAIQHVGESTCSLGEVRQRSDLVIFWGADPLTSHPRHFERYSVDPASEFLPNGRADRTVITIDSEETETARASDLFFKVAPKKDFEMIWALRQLLRDETQQIDVDCGIPLEQLRDLAQRMKSCRYGSVFFGLGLAQQSVGHATVEGLLRMVAELNAETRFIARRLRIPGDVAGADSVLCWQTGFPFGVNFSKGYPRYNPGEFTANEMLKRGEIDSCIIVGSESISMFSESARNAISSLPTIVLDYPHQNPSWIPTVQFTTAVYGLHAEGTAYRMDEIPIPLRKIASSSYATDHEILEQIHQRFAENGRHSGK